MIFPDYPEGVEPADLVSDLRGVVKDKLIRARLLSLTDAVRSGAKLTYAEIDWLRSEARKRRTAVRELHESRDRIHLTNKKLEVGADRLAALHRAAARATARRIADRLSRAEAEVAEVALKEEDLGI